MMDSICNRLQHDNTKFSNNFLKQLSGLLVIRKFCREAYVHVDSYTYRNCHGQS